MNIRNLPNPCRLLALLAITLPLAAAPTPLARLQAEMRARQYNKVAALADQIAAVNDADAVHALYLKANALLLAKRYPEAIAAANNMLAAFPKSPWEHKAVFLKAQALIELKRFADAAAIYETEAARILSAERKQSLAGEVLRFAAKLEAKPDPNVPDAPKPDFAKAYSLYTKVLAMELPRGFREDILFRKARAIHQSGNPSQAIHDYQAYLAEYDPAWSELASSGSVRMPKQNPLPAGRHIAMARFHLAEATHQCGRADAARMELEDLLKKILPDAGKPAAMTEELASEVGKRLPADIRWLMVQSYFNPGHEPLFKTHSMGGNGDSGHTNSNAPIVTIANGDLDQALKACRDYLAAHDSGSRAVRVAWTMAEAQQSAGRADDAITAYRDIITGTVTRLPEGDAAYTYDEEIGATPSTYLANLRMRAMFRVGQILAEQKNYQHAIATWQSYIRDFPNGPDWSGCQSAIINAEFQMGMDALLEKREELAKQRFDEFLRAHPLDNRAPRILYLFGAIHEAKAKEIEETAQAKDAATACYRKAIDEWTKLAGKYPASPEAIAAMLKSGALLEDKLGEHEQALKLYQKLAADHGDSRARDAIARLTQKSLSVATERVFRTNEKAVVRVKSRNIDRCEVRLYRIDLQAYFRKIHGVGGVEQLDVSLIQPDMTWTYKPDGYGKYKPLEQDVEIPFDGNEAGACVVTIGDDDWESTVLVLRSDLEVIVKSSRRELLAFVQDMLTGKPARDVEVLVSNGKEVANSGKTGEDGVYKTSLEALKDLNDVRVFALRKGHANSFNLPLAGLKLSTGLTPKGYLYTDRPAYLSGETVAMRGVLREVKNGSYAMPEDAAFQIRFSDPQGRILSEQAVKLSEFGTFDAVLQLPAQAAIGRYTMTASREVHGKDMLAFQGSFEVREFKLEKIKMSMELPRRVYFRGEKIEVTVRAAYYWGEPVANRELRCILPDRRIVRATTDTDGKASLDFDTTGSSPGSVLHITATLDNENVGVTESVTLARRGYAITLIPSQPVCIAGETLDLAVNTTGADGKPVGETVKIAVLRKETAKTARILDLLPWSQEHTTASAEVKVGEVDARTDQSTGWVKVPLRMERGGLHVLRVTGTDRFGQPVVAETMIEVSGDNDASKLRVFADAATLKVGEDAKVRVHSRLKPGLALITWEGETILRHQIVALHRDYNPIDFTAGHELFPNFRLAIAAIDGRELRTASKEFTVERELKVTVKPLRDAYMPGEQGKVEIRVNDQTGRPVVAELSLALVNEAMFTVCPDTTPKILDFFQKEARRHADFYTGATCAFRYDGGTRPVSKALSEEKNRLDRSLKEQEESQRARAELSASLASPAAAKPQAGPIGLAGDARGASRRKIGRDDGKSIEDDPFANEVQADGQIGDKLVMGKIAEATGEQSDGMAPEAPRREVRGEGRWLPSLRTGTDGVAIATIPMPESTTAWRLTARGCTVETLVGEATATTLTRKDFIVEIKAPSFLREGDVLRLTARAHNLTDAAGEVPMVLRVLDARDRSKELARREKTVAVPAHGGAETTFDAITLPNIPELALELSARAEQLSDALALTLPVLPWGLPYIAHAGGSTQTDAAAVLRLPDGRAYSSAWMTIIIGPDIQSAVLDMALRRTGPAGIIARSHATPWGEHPANDLLAVASALAYANADVAGQAENRLLAGRARELVAALVSTQAADGSWTGNVPGNPTTARAYWALVAARNAGIVVHRPCLDKAATCLLKQLEGIDANDSDNKAVVLHALSTDKLADFAACNRLYRDRHSLGAATLAYLTRTFANIDRKDYALELAGILEAKAVEAADQPVLWESGCKIAWMNDSAETTALVLLALAQSKPDSPRAEAAAQSLLHQRGCFDFPSGRSRGPAIAALALWFGRGKEQPTDREILVQVNGRIVRTVKAIAGASQSRIDVPMELLKNTENNLVELKMRGRGMYTWAATLGGFSSVITPTGPTEHPGIDSWSHWHAPLEYRGRSIGVPSSSPVNSLEYGQRVSVRIADHQGHWHNGRWFTLDIPLPAGARLVDGSLSVSDNTSITELHPSFLRVYFANRCPAVGYELSGYAPGTYRMPPCTIREVGNPSFLHVGPSPALTILAPGERSPDPYLMNIHERFALGKCHFDDGDVAGALEYLAAVFKENPKHVESELARMLLWIHTKTEFYDAGKIVVLFEILRERYPTLEIPFDKLLIVGRAYKDIGENERAWLVYRAVIAASFANDSAISAVLEDEGRFLGSITFQESVWRAYPDTADVVSSYFALSQLLYQKAPKAHDLPEEDQGQPEKIAMLKRAVDMLVEFLAMYPSDPLADDAGFSLCNAMLDLKDYARVVALSREFAARHANSLLAPGLQYMTALGLFWQNQRNEALAAARVVADGDSKDRDFARYILGQIYHAESQPAEAIRWYGMVKDLYPDAAEAIDYFENKSIAVEEVLVCRPGKPVTVTLKYRNIREAFLQVYRVDLMKLYLQEKNLSAITSVQLAGIKPEFEQTIALGDGRDYVGKERVVPLALKDEAAYLVICRGDDLFTSGMILVTPLKLEVQEDPASGRVRANVLDTTKGGYRPEVHVKAIGSADAVFRSGETDLRGLFVADNLRGKATVIAREGASRYAFFRGDSWLGEQENVPQKPQPRPARKTEFRYQDNLNQQNDAIQDFNRQQFDQQRRQPLNQGVQVKKAF